MRSKKLDRTRKIGFEHLENHAMMAGNVSASVEGGDLLIKGTTHDNFVLVTRFNDGTVKVAGVPGTNTRINGQSSVRLGDVSGGLFANLGSGNDGIAILKGTFFGEVDIRTGNGIDGVLVTKLNAFGLNISTGAATDVVVVAGVNIGGGTQPELNASQVEFGGVNISTGAGKDFVFLTLLRAESIFVSTGVDQDIVGLLGVHSRGTLGVELGSGDMDILAAAKSSASFANFQGGANILDIHVYARNEFEEQLIEGFQFQQSFDAFVDQIESLIKSAEPFIKQLPSIKNLPNFSL